LSKEREGEKEANDGMSVGEERLVNSEIIPTEPLTAWFHLFICPPECDDIAYVDALVPRLGVGLGVVVPIFEAPL
jgi:hypothetical protein